MDGVLYDSMPLHVRAWRETMSLYGIEGTEEDFYLFEGRTGASTIDILFRRFLNRDATPDEIREIYARKSFRFNELGNPGAPPMPGALEILEITRKAGVERVLVTGSGQSSLIDMLQKDFPGAFREELMVTAYDVQFGKPNPEPYLMGLQKAGIKPGEGLVVENAPLGVEAGKAAGIYTIAVNTGPLPDQTLLDAGADRIFSSMTELAETFETILQPGVGS